MRSLRWTAGRTSTWTLSEDAYLLLRLDHAVSLRLGYHCLLTDSQGIAWWRKRLRLIYLMARRGLPKPITV